MNVMQQRCNCGVDVHAHVIPASFPRSVKTPEPESWPSMRSAQPCHKHVMIAGKIYRTVSDRCWDVPKRVSDMEEMGLRLQVVSPMPELLSYWMNADDADELLRYINDQTAEMIAQADGRLVGLGAVPLQDIDLAIAELRRVKLDLGFAGVEVGSNINGRPIGAPEFDAFFAAAEELGAAVFVHALRPSGMDRLIGPSQLQQVIAYPSDVGLAAASVITTNLMVRRPKLRIAFSHGGGTLGLLLPRLSEGHRVFAPLRESIQPAPAEQARLLFYDSLVYDEAALRYLVNLFGENQIMLGTDHPFNFHDRTPVDRVLAAFDDQLVRQQLVSENAMRFLGLSKGASA
jgi:aminocarboxymuconate-semialdehyde decarboxylase